MSPGSVDEPRASLWPWLSSCQPSFFWPWAFLSRSYCSSANTAISPIFDLISNVSAGGLIGKERKEQHWKDISTLLMVFRCSLISLSVAESIRRTKAASADDSSSLQPPQSTCQDPLCDFSISSVTRELETARERIQALQQQLGQVEKKTTCISSLLDF